MTGGDPTILAFRTWTARLTKEGKVLASVEVIATSKEMAKHNLAEVVSESSAKAKAALLNCDSVVWSSRKGVW